MPGRDANDCPCAWPAPCRIDAGSRSRKDWLSCDMKGGGWKGVSPPSSPSDASSMLECEASDPLRRADDAPLLVPLLSWSAPLEPGPELM